MTATSRDLAAADEAILEGLALRLAAVDAELPRLPRWRTDRVAAGQLHVVRGRMRRAGRERVAPAGHRFRFDVAAAAVATIAVIATFALGHDSGVGQPFQPTTPTPPGPALSFGPVGAAEPSGGPATAVPTTPTPTPAPTRAPGLRPGSPDPTVVPLTTTVEAAGAQAVLSRMAWRCGVLVQVGLVPLPAGMVDKLALTARDGGAVALPDGLGLGIGIVTPDPAVAARMFKGRLLLSDELGSAWVLRGDEPDGSVLQLVPARSDSGTVVWRSADVIWPSVCPAPGADVNVKTLIATQPPGAWPPGQIVGLTVVRLVPLATSRTLPR